MKDALDLGLVERRVAARVERAHLAFDEVEMAFGVTTDAVEALAARVRELEAERDAALGSVADHVLIPRTTYNQIVQALTNCKDHKLPRVSVRRDHLKDGDR